MQRKTQNQEIEYHRRQLRIEKYTTEYDNYLLQQNRLIKQLNKLKETKDDKIVWKDNLRFEEGDNKDEYDVAIFNYPKYKKYNLSRDKLDIVQKRLKNEKNYLNFLKRKINKNKY